MFYVSPDVSWRFSTYYGQTYVPNHFTDGLVNRIGSGNYNNYVNDYLQRHSVSAPLAITILENTLGSNTAYVKVRVTLEQSLPSGHTIYIGLWEDNVVVGGTYGSTPTRFIERALAQTSLTITNGSQSQEFEYTFNLNQSWKRADLGITTWVQGPNSPQAEREVHNARAARFVTTAVAPASLGQVKALFR